MIEVALFIGAAWLITKTKTWTKGPYVSDHINLATLFTSCFDAGPLRFKDEQDNDDPNSNPDYIWNETS